MTDGDVHTSSLLGYDFEPPRKSVVVYCIMLMYCSIFMVFRIMT